MDARPARSPRGPCTTLARVGLAALAGVAPGLPTAAAGVFVPPAGCRLELTVQERACSVAQHYRCDADPEGTQRTTYFGQGGEAVYESLIDAETRWLSSRDPQSGIEDRLEDGAADDASLSGLLKTGRDAFDFWTVASDGMRLHHVGEDRLTGETVTIDGEPLQVTQFRLVTQGADGATLISREGQQFVSARLRLFFGGIERESDWTGTAEQVNHSPMQFIAPGEPGFGATRPLYDCEQLTASLGPEDAR